MIGHLENLTLGEFVRDLKKRYERIKSIKRMSETLAAHKYLVLSKSSSIYNEIREYLKRENAQVRHVLTLIDQARTLPEDRGQVCNAFQHIWGYFKKQATRDEKAEFMYCLEQYRSGQAEQEILLGAVRKLLAVYPNKYLQQSHLLFGEQDETVASRYD